MKKLILLILIITNLVYAKHTISEKAYKKLQKAQQFIEKNQYTKALDILNLIVKNSKNSMEKTYALQSLANISIHQTEYKKVITYYEKIIVLNGLEKNNMDKIKFSLSQIYLAESLYVKSINYSLELLKNTTIKKSHLYENLALAYYYDTQYKKSLQYIKKVIAFKKEKEAWHRMLYSSYVELKKFHKAIDTLKLMIKQYKPKEEYWMQLVSLYQRTEQDKKSLATLELAYDKNVLSKKNNIMYLVSMLLQNEVYNKAALIMQKNLQKGILEHNQKNFDILISSYLNAKNYTQAVPKLRKSKFANTQKYKLILGNIHYNNSDYNNAIQTLSQYKFIKNSKIDGQRNTLISLCFYELENKKESKRYLKKAMRNKFEKKHASNIAKNLGYKI